MKRSLLLLVLLAGGLLARGGWTPARGTTVGCVPSATRLCLAGNRFAVEAAWTVPGLGAGAGQAVPLTGDTGVFWFFAGSNLELTVKVLDGRAVNHHFWIFFGGLSDVAYMIKVTDLQTGIVETYQNPPGRFASVADVNAFQAEAPPAAVTSAASAKENRLAALAAADDAPVPLSAEIPVAAATTGGQSVPAVAIAPDGGFLAIWKDDLDVPATVHGRLYDASGTPRGAAVRLSAPGAPASNPRVAADPSGRFLAVWSNDQGIAGRLLEPGGTPLGNETLLAPGANLFSPDVIADPAGGFLLSWRAPSALPPDSAIHLQRFDLRLTPGSQTVVDAPGFPDAPPWLAALAPGGYVLTWGTSNPTIDTPNANLWAQRLDPALQAVGSVLSIATLTPGEGYGLPVAYTDGGFAYLWNTGALLSDEFDGVMARRFDPDGTPAGDAVQLRQGKAMNRMSLGGVALPSGNTWVVWQERGLPEDADGGVYSGLFDPSWQLQGGVSRVNTGTVGVQAEPVVASGPGGTVAVWSSVLTPAVDPPVLPGDVLGIFAQRFSAPDCALASDQLCLGGRFRVTARFTDPRSGGSAAAQAIPLTGDTGAFWFFDAANLELTVKVLDGRPLNGHFWVFSGALSDVEYTLTVTDLVTSQTKTYYNAPHQLASRADTAAF